MSGFAVVYNQKNRLELDTMIRTISHRGPYLSGKFESKRVGMAQNYLRGDIDAKENDILKEDNVLVPVHDIKYPEFRICYDGQMGNRDELVQTHGIADGPFQEERLLLRLYKQYGSRMFEHLDDAIFAFVISDGEKLFAARDLLGIKTLFYGRKNRTLYLSSELKSLIGITDKIYEFPAGYFMDSTYTLFRFAELPEFPPKIIDSNLDEVTAKIRDIIVHFRWNPSRIMHLKPRFHRIGFTLQQSVISFMQ